MTFQKEDLYKPNDYNEKVTCQEYKDNEVTCRLINSRTKKKNHTIWCSYPEKSPQRLLQPNKMYTFVEF